MAAKRASKKPNSKDFKVRLKKGDTVIVIAGSHKGKTGKIQKVVQESLKVFVEGVNLQKRHMKPDQKNPQGGTKLKEGPVHYSNVMLLDTNRKPTRIKMKATKGKDGKETFVRTAQTTGLEL